MEQTMAPNQKQEEYKHLPQNKDSDQDYNDKDITQYAMAGEGVAPVIVSPLSPPVIACKGFVMLDWVLSFEND